MNILLLSLEACFSADTCALRERTQNLRHDLHQLFGLLSNAVDELLLLLLRAARAVLIASVCKEEMIRKVESRCQKMRFLQWKAGVDSSAS